MNCTDALQQVANQMIGEDWYFKLIQWRRLGDVWDTTGSMSGKLELFVYESGALAMSGSGTLSPDPLGLGNIEFFIHPGHPYDCIFFAYLPPNRTTETMLLLKDATCQTTIGRNRLVSAVLVHAGPNPERLTDSGYDPDPQVPALFDTLSVFRNPSFSGVQAAPRGLQEAIKHWHQQQSEQVSEATPTEEFNQG